MDPTMASISSWQHASVARRNDYKNRRKNKMDTSLDNDSFLKLLLMVPTLKFLHCLLGRNQFPSKRALCHFSTYPGRKTYGSSVGLECVQPAKCLRSLRTHQMSLEISLLSW